MKATYQAVQSEAVNKTRIVGDIAGWDSQAMKYHVLQLRA